MFVSNRPGKRRWHCILLSMARCGRREPGSALSATSIPHCVFAVERLPLSTLPSSACRCSTKCTRNTSVAALPRFSNSWPGSIEGCTSSSSLANTITVFPRLASAHRQRLVLGLVALHGPGNLVVRQPRRPSAYAPVSQAGSDAQGRLRGNATRRHHWRRLWRHCGSQGTAACGLPGDADRPAKLFSVPAAALPGRDRRTFPGRYRWADSQPVSGSTQCPRAARRGNRRRLCNTRGYPAGRPYPLRLPCCRDWRSPQLFRA
jgi:hypothetical protein